MTVTLTVPIDWDAWRASYDEMSFADQRAFYDRVFAEFPEQARFSTRVLGEFLAELPSGLEVVELGGWDGEFAAEMLAASSKITRWINWEISQKALDSRPQHNKRYWRLALDDWYWNASHSCDLFVASHVLEHLKLRDVLATFDATDCRWMYLQAPLAEEPTNWRGYRGSHILEVGWEWITAELDARGFDYLPAVSHPWARCFARRT